MLEKIAVNLRPVRKQLHCAEPPLNIDTTNYRRRLADFDEFIDNESIAGVTVQRLSERLGAGETLG